MRSVVPEKLAITLEIAPVSEALTVAAEPTGVQLEADTSTSHVDIDKSYIARAPATVASRAMEQIITSTPGFAKDENGRFHFQGAHSQSEYVIDGQTISDQTGTTFSNSIDPGIAQAMEVIYGNVPAEYGEKIGAVINLSTRSGLASGRLHGEAFLGASRFATGEGGASVGYGIEYVRPLRLADWVEIGPLSRPGQLRQPAQPGRHGPRVRAARLGAGRHPIRSASPRSSARRTATCPIRTRSKLQARTSASNRATRTQLRLAARALADSVLEVVAFARISTFRLDPSAEDTPVTVTSRRSLDNYGLAPSVTWAAGVHEIKMGAELKRFPINERFSFGSPIRR